MANAINIVDAIKNPKLFGSLPRFKKLDTWTAWLVVLKAIFGLPMTADDLAIFQRHTGRASPPLRRLQGNLSHHRPSWRQVVHLRIGHLFHRLFHRFQSVHHRR